MARHQQGECEEHGSIKGVFQKVKTPLHSTVSPGTSRVHTITHLYCLDTKTAPLNSYKNISKDAPTRIHVLTQEKKQNVRQQAELMQEVMRVGHRHL